MSAFPLRIAVLLETAIFCATSILGAASDRLPVGDRGPIPNLSQALGNQLGQQLYKESFPLDNATFARGMSHGLTNGRPEIFYPRIRRITAKWKKEGSASLKPASGLSAGDSTNQLNYATGFNAGSYLRNHAADLSVDSFVEAVRNVYDRVPQSKSDEETSLKALRTFVTRSFEFSRPLTFDPAEINQKESEAFMFRNNTNKEFATTKYGYQYKVVRRTTAESSSGPLLDEDVVTFTSRMFRLVNGQMPPISGVSGQPVVHTNRLDDIKLLGVKRALSKMHVGDIWHVVMPPNIGFGQDGYKDYIGPNAAFVMELHLIHREEGVSSYVSMMRTFDRVDGLYAPNAAVAREMKATRPQSRNPHWEAQRDSELRKLGSEMDAKIANAIDLGDSVLALDLKSSKEVMLRTIKEKWENPEYQIRNSFNPQSPERKTGPATAKESSDEYLEKNFDNPWNATPPGIWKTSITSWTVQRHLTITIRADGNGTFYGFLDDPGLKLVGVRLGEFEYDGINICFDVPQIKARFTGTFSRYPDKFMGGTWEEDGKEVSVTWRP